MKYIMKGVAWLLLATGVAKRKPQPRYLTEDDVWSVNGKYR